MTDDPATDAPASPAATRGKTRLKQAGIVAAVALAPGGFLLGGLLIARAMKKRREAKAADAD